MKRIKLIVAAVCLLLLVFSCKNTSHKDKEKTVYLAEWESLKKHKVPEWFSDGKFGIYFHWGIYSVPAYGHEWYSHFMYNENVSEFGSISGNWGEDIRPHHVAKYGKNFQYHQFIPMFTAEHFNADEWATLFKNSGAKWAGIVAEHGDNFSLWNSKVNPWNAARMGPTRDLVGELDTAINKAGLKFITTFHHHWTWAWYPVWNGLVDTSTVELKNFYGGKTLPETFERSRPENFEDLNSLPEIYRPPKKFIATWKAKVLEVIDNYKPDLIWFDSRLNLIPDKDKQELMAYYYNKGEEWGKPVVFNYKNKDIPVDAGVIDIERGRLEEKVDYAWLTDDSWDWDTWCYTDDHNYKTANHILDGLIDIVSKNGCLLLNITPRADGTIPDEIENGLLDIGAWLKVYGDAIYKTKPFVTFGEGPTKLKKGPYGGASDEGIEYGPDDFRFTTHSNMLYIIQLGIPPTQREFLLSTFATGSAASDVKIKSVHLLGSEEEVNWKRTNEGLRLTSPKTVSTDKALVYVALME